MSVPPWAFCSAPRKTNEVVEYALSRSLRPAMIAEYQTQLPDKQMLAARLREFYLQQAGV